MVYIVFDDHPDYTLTIFFVELQNRGSLKLCTLREHSSMKVPSPLLYAKLFTIYSQGGNSYLIAIYKIHELSVTAVVVQLK